MITKIKQTIVENCFLSALHAPSDTDNCAISIHKLFIEEQVRILEDIKSNMYVMVTEGNLYRVVDEDDVTLLISQLKDQLK